MVPLILSINDIKKLINKKEVKRIGDAIWNVLENPSKNFLKNSYEASAYAAILNFFNAPVIWTQNSNELFKFYKGNNIIKEFVDIKSIEIPSLSKDNMIIENIKPIGMDPSDYVEWQYFSVIFPVKQVSIILLDEKERECKITKTSKDYSQFNFFCSANYFPLNLYSSFFDPSQDLVYGVSSSFFEYLHNYRVDIQLPPLKS